MAVLPTPAQLVEVTDFDELPEVKLRRLRGVAAAALDGRLDTAELKALPVPDAEARLQRARRHRPLLRTDGHHPRPRPHRRGPPDRADPARRGRPADERRRALHRRSSSPRRSRPGHPGVPGPVLPCARPVPACSDNTVAASRHRDLGDRRKFSVSGRSSFVWYVALRKLAVSVSISDGTPLRQNAAWSLRLRCSVCGSTTVPRAAGQSVPARVAQQHSPVTGVSRGRLPRPGDGARRTPVDDEGEVTPPAALGHRAGRLRKRATRAGRQPLRLVAVAAHRLQPDHRPYRTLAGQPTGQLRGAHEPQLLEVEHGQHDRHLSRAQQPGHLQERGHPRRVVVGARTVPHRVEMGSDHHRRTAPRPPGDQVDAGQAAIGPYSQQPRGQVGAVVARHPQPRGERLALDRPAGSHELGGDMVLGCREGIGVPAADCVAPAASTSTSRRIRSASARRTRLSTSAASDPPTSLSPERQRRRSRH